MTDPHIAAIVVVANTVDIEAGKLAQLKTKNPKVKLFADTMVSDHAAVNKAAVALVTKLGATPGESETSRGLTASGESPGLAYFVTAALTPLALMYQGHVATSSPGRFGWADSSSRRAPRRSRVSRAWTGTRHS